MCVTKDEKFIGNSETSFAPCLTDSGHVVLSTKPKILFCDVGLSPGENKSCKCKTSFNKSQSLLEHFQDSVDLDLKYYIVFLN